jgi:hypothetical protein
MLFRHLFRPLDTTSLLLIVFFTLAFKFCLHGGIYGLIMSVLVLSWFFKYAYVLVDATANGVKETPVLSAEMLNPLDEQRPAAQLIICVGVGWLSYWVGGIPGIVIAVLGLLYLPASVAVLGASSRALEAVNPLALTRTIIGLGAYYPLMLGVIAVYAFAVIVLSRTNVWETLEIAFILFCVLSIFSGLGGALYERRHELGFDATHTPERIAERAERERSRDRAKALDEVYGEARGGNFMAARDSLLRWLRQVDADELEQDVRYICSQARTWQDEKAFVFVSRFLISQLVEMNKTGTVVEVVDQVLQRAPALKLGTASDTVKIATLARAAGKRALALRVLAQFEAQFPGDARIDEVVSLRSQIAR